MQSSIPEPRLLPRQLHQLRPQWLIAAPRLVAVSRDRHHDHTARPPLAEGILLLHLPDSCLQRYELHPFFRITDCNASLSRLRSATSFLSRVFSSRNCFASCAWLTSIPSYLCFSRATSSTARPASTCFKAAIICASVCLLRDMLIPLSFDEIIINFVRNQGSRSGDQCPNCNLYWYKNGSQIEQATKGMFMAIRTLAKMKQDAKVTVRLHIVQKVSD